MSEPSKTSGEPTPLTLGVILYYSSCAAVSIGAAVAAMVLIVFPDETFTIPVAILGIALVLSGGFGAWHFLRSARKETR